MAIFKAQQLKIVREKTKMWLYRTSIKSELVWELVTLVSQSEIELLSTTEKDNSI